MRLLSRVVATCFFDRSRAGIFPLAITLIALPWYTQDQAAVDASHNSISGTVLNSVTREPVGRAMVYSADQRYATFTDDHGRFELTLLPAELAAGANAQFVLDARRPGFRSRGSSLVRAGQGEVTLSLIPEGLITGKVKFPSDDAGDHVQVELYRREIREGLAQWMPTARDSTKADGEFRFADLTPGDYKAFTLENMEQGQPATGSNEPRWGFPPRFFPAARDFGSAETIHLRAGETFVANISLERQRYYDVRVPVVGMEEGMPEGLRVSVYAQGHRGPGYELGFNRAQRVISGSLPNGTYTIEATGYGPNAGTGSTSITVANQPAVGPPLAIVANPSIDVTIRKDLSGADSAASQRASTPGGTLAQVSLMPAEEVTGPRGTRTHSSQGEPPTISGVQPGRYWVQVRPFAEGYPASVTSGGKDLLREPLVVPYGSSVPPIEVTLRYDTGEVEAVIEGAEVTRAGSPGSVPGSAGSVMGSVAGSTGSTMGIVTSPPGIVGASARIGPLMQRGLSVYCIPLDSNRVMPDPPQTNVMTGQTRWIQLPPGEYRVLAFSSPRELEYRNPAAMKIYEIEGQIVKVTPGQKAQVTVRVIENE